MPYLPYEVCVLAALLLKVADLIIETMVKGQPLYRRHIKHVRQSGVADGEYLFPDDISSRQPAARLWRLAWLSGWP